MTSLIIVNVNFQLSVKVIRLSMFLFDGILEAHTISLIK